MLRHPSLAVLLTAALAAAPTAAMADSHVEIPPQCEAPPEILAMVDNVVIGTEGDDVLRGTSGADFICGDLGDDVIFGLGGDDVILADTTTFFGNVRAPGGDDVVHAGAGDDEVLPGPGDDKVFGDAGDDFLALAVGDDLGNGGAGADEIIGGFGQDVVLGGADDDFLAGGLGDDLLNGGRGDDVLAGELPPGAPPAPPGVELPDAGQHDRCIGGPGQDAATDCDVEAAVESAL